jgi:hypothetical protein
VTAEADAHARADEHDHKAESRRSAGATGLLATVATDDAVEDFSRGLGGVRFVEEMGEIRAVHYVLSKRRGGSFAQLQFRDGLRTAPTSPDRLGDRGRLGAAQAPAASTPHGHRGSR